MSLVKFFDMLPGWAWAILLAMALSVGCAENTVIHIQRAKIAELKEAKATLQGDYNKAALALSEANRKIEDLRTKAMEEINDIVDEERGKTSAAVRDGAAVRSMLLDATNRYATLRGSSSDPAALARAEERAAVLGKLLGQCDAVAADLGRDAEGLATQVRGLQRAYLSLIETGGLRARPLADGLQVHPGEASVWHVEVLPASPVAALDAGLDP